MDADRLRDPAFIAFNQGADIGVRVGIHFAAAIIESSCNHWFFCPCKKIARTLREGSISFSAEILNSVNNKDEHWDDVIGE